MLIYKLIIMLIEFHVFFCMLRCCILISRLRLRLRPPLKKLMSRLRLMSRPTLMTRLRLMIRPRLLISCRLLLEDCVHFKPGKKQQLLLQHLAD
jgi:hypothetical protein